MNKRISVILKIAICFIIAFSLSLVETAFAEEASSSANGSSGGGDGAVGGSCKIDKEYTTYNECLGAVWIKYPAESDHIYIPPLIDVRTGKKVAEGGYIDGCKTNGGHYYRLGFAGYDPKTGKFDGSQAGLVPVDDISKTFPGGKGNIPMVSTVPNAVNWNDVLGNFNTALNHNVQGFKTDWTSGGSKPATAWFCWDEKWKDNPKDPVVNKPSPTIEAPDPTTPGENHFYSTSGVRVEKQGFDIEKHEIVSDPDSTAAYWFSTDEPQVEVKFFHEIVYHHETPDVKDPDKYETPTTKWETTGEGPLYSGETSGAKVVEIEKANYTIDTVLGGWATACQNIDYEPKNIKFESTPETKCLDESRTSATCPEEKKYKYYPIAEDGRTGKGGSQICVSIYRPKEPIEDNNIHEKSFGGANSELMYAGEDAMLGFMGNGVSYTTRRINHGQSFVYLYDSKTKGTPDKSKGTIGSMRKRPFMRSEYSEKDPCSFFGGAEKCKDLQNPSFNSSESGDIPALYSYSPNMKVPNLVGHKYCNSFGFYHEYYYAFVRNGTPTWYPESQFNYWNIYDAACRTIAKKPSIAFWNGSMFTISGVTTSLSNRYPENNPLFGQLAGAGRINFGSWVENNAVVGGSVSGFASGSGLSRGGSVTSGLTISNRNGLGNSQIPTNSAFYIRLMTYFAKNFTSCRKIDNDWLVTGQCSTEADGDATWSANMQISKTHIIHVTGNLTINENIILTPGSYTNIYNIPQVVLIVDGDVDIASGVEQIDAWIVTSGKIKTCSSFQEINTFTWTTESDPGVCDNKLVFNGPIITGSIDLRRTGGSDPMIADNVFSSNPLRQRYTSAEIFNLSAETYLWAFAQAGRYSSSYTEAYIRELPPRY